MGMQQIKRYRFTCDGEVIVDTPVGAVKVTDACHEEVVVEAVDKWAAVNAMPDGWRATGPIPDGVDVRCPKEHVY